MFSIHFPPCDASSPPANGAVGDCTSVLESGTTCQPVCDPGYAVSGPSVCEDGVLSPAVCIPPCDASAPPANGGVGDCTNELMSGTTCQPTCDVGYAASGPSTCEDGVLSPAVCIPPCDASAPPANGGVGDCTNELMSGTTCQPTCDVGYAASGPSTCEDGVLSPAVCIPPCDASAPPANGGVGDCTNELMSGTTCQPTCDVGYAASGPSTCEDGVFSPAVCIGVLHLVADDITDVDLSNNLVQSWSDHTGNGLSLSSFVAAPELVDGGSISTGALFNGHKAVRFGESGITGLSLPTSALRISTSLEGMTVVAVMSTDSRDAIIPRLFDRGEYSPRGFGCDISPARVSMHSATNYGGMHSPTLAAAPIENGKMYVVTAQWKFAKSGVSGHQLLTSQHGNLSNPDLINVTAHTWTGTGVDYSRPFVIGTQSKGNRRAGRYLEGYVAEFRYYFQVLDQDELTAIQDELLYKYGASCDASAPPANGEVGDCTNELISGTTCQPTCDVGYAASGPSTCKDGVLSPAVCIGVLHLVADDITDVDAGNLVQSWSDHTGNGLSLSSFVAAPELVDGGNISTGALFNGHKAVRFGESGITGLSLPTSALRTFDFPRGNDRRRGDEHGRQSGCHRSVPVRPR